ncbi:MAG: SDR family oxidoreductase [Gemmatimonadaceae bacterium]|nr:SDR family oxidoreductase [Acetobacteraceae bacterium]
MPAASPVAVVTGATGGLGYATAAGLARAGAHVVLTGRNPAKGAAALARLRRDVPGAQSEFALLDVASLPAVAAFADRIAADHPAIGILVNNAGLMAPPRRQVTAEGFELQFATNYLGHFALTARLLPALIAGRARVVQVSSVAHRRAAMAWDDLQGARHFNTWALYGQSKLAMLIFAVELARRAAAQGWPLTSIAAHPGWAVTDIILNGPAAGASGLREKVMQAGFRLFGQSAQDGARPIVYAATAPEAQAGRYYGPAGFQELRGPPAPARIMPQAADPAAGQRLWSISEGLAGLTFGAG